MERNPADLKCQNGTSSGQLMPVRREWRGEKSELVTIRDRVAPLDMPQSEADIRVQSIRSPRDMPQGLMRGNFLLRHQ